jgi:hypothetical protein
MLRTLILAGFVSLGASAASSAVVMNGDFESVDDRAGITGGNSQGDKLNSLAGSNGSRSWDVYTSLPGGWVNKNTAGKPRGAGIEVQTQKTLGSIDAHSGNHYIELDSENTGDGMSNSNLAQDIFLKAGMYDLKFWYAPRVGNNVATNGIASSIFTDVLDVLVTDPSNMTGRTENGWTEIVRRFSVDQDTNATLLFSARGPQDELGGLIDTVSIEAVPLPAGVVLMLSGLAGLGAMRRFKKS